MAPAASPAVLQTATPAIDVGPEQLVDLWPALVRAGWFLAGFLVVVIVGWYVVEPAVSRAVRRRNRDNPTIQEAISRYVRLLVLVVAVLVAAAVAGYGRFVSDSAIVIAALTLAVGVAGRVVIGSIVSGLVLVADPEFGVGNYVSWADGEGTVRSITLRVTRVETPNGELVTIPNTTLTSQAFVRPFGRGRYRVVHTIELAYEDDVDEALAHLEAAARELEAVLPEPAPTAYVDELGADGVVVRVHYWIEDPRRRDVVRVRSAYVRGAKARLQEAGLTVSPPSQRDLQGRIQVDGAA